MKKKQHFLLFVLVALVGLHVTAAIPSGYYNTALGKTDQELMTSLHKIVRGHNLRSYQNLWSDFRTTDCNGSIIIDRYSTTQFTYSTDQCGTYNALGDCYNREHSVPNSWWGATQDTMYSDLYHMYPVDGWVNNQRGNYPFGDCANGTACGTGKLGTCTHSGYSGTVFEVADEYKGDFARTYFYMVVRYMDRVGSWTSGQGSAVFTNSSYKHLTPWAISQLLEWHRNDPVSTLESNRNEAVYGIQRNRNPFIDHPELAEFLWGNYTGTAWTGSASTSPVISSPSNGSTINVGTNTGSGVSKTITVKGVYLTKSVTVSVSGSGFSVTPTTLTAAAVNAGTSITVTYNGTATNATGTLTFSSSELTCTVTLTATYNTGGGSGGTETIETWEGCTNYGSYNTTSIQGHAFAWTVNNVGIWSGDPNCNDVLSCRFGKNADSYIEMAEDVTDGASMVTFYAAKWNNNEATPTLQLLYSTNGGSTWTSVGTCSPTATWQQYIFNLNVTGNVRFKIQQTAGARLNIDDIAITSNNGAVVNPQITAPTNGSTVNVGTIAATGSSVSKTISVKGSDLTKALNVSVSGTGFSVSPTTISAANANTGTTITVTYTSSTAGDATGTLTISSSEASVTVNLTASKTANPQITAPTNGSTINVGTIAATGSSVSKTISVKGSDLTKALNVSVSGTGFSVTPTTISAANANIGTTITVTYTSSTAGNATGTLTISSSEASVTVNLTASKTANPQITSPTNGSTVNVGTIAATGTSVSKTISVKGSDLTKALNVSVSGTGFSVTPTTISAANANTGTTITVTYTSSTAGNATGTLTISSSEASVMVNLTASKIASPTISITSVPAMEAEQDGVSSVVQGSVSADNNNANITLSVEGNFELSLNRYYWSRTLTLDPTGEVFYVRLADTGTVGEYYGSITATTGVVSAYADIQGTVTAKPFKIGDVNMDGEVDINDITSLISYVLGNTVSPFDNQAANVNGDDTIDINDITQLISIVLGASQSALKAGTWDAVPVEGGILIENYSGEMLEVYNMDADCCAVMMCDGETVVDLPQGIYLVSGDTASRKVVVK